MKNQNTRLIVLSSILTSAVITLAFNLLGYGLPSYASEVIVSPPTITRVSPFIVRIGDPSFTVTVDGTGFVNGSSISIEGSKVTTTFVSSTRLTTVLPAPTEKRVLHITANNIIGTSNTMALSVLDPLPPVINSISPAIRRIGDPSFTLTVNGTGFVNSSSIYVNGSQLTTTFVSAIKLTAVLPAPTQKGVLQITVDGLSPAPKYCGDGVCNSNEGETYSNCPVDCGSSIPSTCGNGACDSGETYSNCPVDCGSLPPPPPPPAPKYCGDGVCNSNEGETCSNCPGDCNSCSPTLSPKGMSNTMALSVLDPLPPVINSISPSIRRIGSPSFTLNVNGSGFDNGSHIYIEGSQQTTTFVSSTRLTTVFPAPAEKRVLYITVDSRGGKSNTMILTVIPPPTPPPPPPPPSTCGNGICSASEGETCSNCPGDCGNCSSSCAGYSDNYVVIDSAQVGIGSISFHMTNTKTSTQTVDVSISSGTVNPAVLTVPAGTCSSPITVTYTASSSAEITFTNAGQVIAIFPVFVNDGPGPTVTSPNGGETWVAGTTHNITWSYNGSSIPQVFDVNLVDSTYGRYGIGQVLGSQNSKSWTISKDIPSGQYTMEVMSSRYTDKIGVSKPFNITEGGSPSQQSLTIISPNGGEAWKFGETRDITWNATGFSPNDEVNILLVDYTSGTYSYAIGKDTILANDKKYSWNTSEYSNIKPGTKFKMYIDYRDSAGFSRASGSSSYFSIVSP